MGKDQSERDAKDRRETGGDEERVPGTTEEGMEQAAMRPSGSGGSATPEEKEETEDQAR